MRGRSSLAVAVAAAAVALLVAYPGRAVGTGIRNVSRTPGHAEGEETVAVNPTDPNNIIVGSNQWQPLPVPASVAHHASTGPSGFTDCAVWSTVDGGATWAGGRISDSGLGPVQLPRLPVLRSAPREFDNPGNVITADQNTVFGSGRNAWYQCIDFGVRTGDVVVNVYHSGDGGRTWDKPVIAFSERSTLIQIDRSYLAIDRRTHTLYLTFETMFYQAWEPRVYERSSTDGMHWGPIVRVDDAARGAMWDPRQYPVVGADGTLYVVYDSAPLVSPCQCDPNDTKISLVVARSTDGGKTFAHSVVDNAVHRVTSPDEAYSYFSELISSIASDPADPNVLAVAWPDDRSGAARILARVSTDHGVSWGPLVDLSAGDGGAQHDHVALAFLPDGRLVAVWRPWRSDWGTRFMIVGRAFTIASNSATTPGPLVPFTTAWQQPTTGTRGNMPSEYLGVTAGSEGVSASWDEMRGAYPDDVYERIPVSAF